MATNALSQIEVQVPSDGVVSQQTTKKTVFQRLRKQKKEENTSKRPPAHKWMQQQMPACRPVFTAVHTFFLFTLVGIVFIVLGAVFLSTAMNLQETVIDYGHSSCTIQNRADLKTWVETWVSNATKNYTTCEDYLADVAKLSNSDLPEPPKCICTVTLTIEKPMKAPVYFYYSLSNFFQNHRRYLNSWSPTQLRGKLNSTKKDECDPLYQDHGKNIVPCGLIANSLFNDTFVFATPGYGIDETGIAWETDKATRFGNPGNKANVTSTDLDGTVQPPSWRFDLSHFPNGLKDEHLIVWFRVSAFPKFRKLYGKVIFNNSISDLQSGTYNINITYNFPAQGFNGGKYLVFSEVSWLGGKNYFLGIAYIVTGALSFVAGCVLLAVHLICSRWKCADKNYLKRPF